MLADQTLFIADLHLQANQPDTIALSLQFLHKAHGVRALYILGDLFEYWLGDDAHDPQLLDISNALTALTASGTRVHLMHGNRDFLLGESYAKRIGATLHRADWLILSPADEPLLSEPVLLMHGDTLCTDDHGYQQLRALVRDQQWQQQFLALTVTQRIEQANELRAKSRAAVADKTMGIMDVNVAAVSAAFTAACVELTDEQHAESEKPQLQQCKLMIHGHTHRPAEHRDAAGNRRIVLGNWHADHAQFARFDGTRFTLETFSTAQAWSLQKRPYIPAPSRE